MTILIKQHMLNPHNWKTEKADPRSLWFQKQMKALSELKSLKFATNREQDWPALLQQEWEHIIIFGEHRCQAPEFINAVKNSGKDYLLCERAPLMKNGCNCLYFENQHLSYNGSFSDLSVWDNIMNSPLSPEKEQTIKSYREHLLGNSQGIEAQYSVFTSCSTIKRKLGIAANKKIIYMPLQVDEDAVIVDKKLSPWINSMQQFIDVVLQAFKSITDDYVLIIKKHPYGSTVSVPDQDNVYYLDNEVNANSLVQASDCLISVNSGSGTEALVFHKKIISLGKSFYSDKGINWEAHSPEELRRLLKNISNFTVEPNRIDRFLYEFIYNRIFDFTDIKDCIFWLENYFSYQNKGENDGY